MRFINVCFIIIFVSMLVLPLVFVDLRPDRISIAENRMLANRPSITEIKNHPGIFIRQFDYWFRDSIGFREKLLVIYKDVIKNKLPSNVVYKEGQLVYLIGEKGHHYYAGINGNLIPKFQGKQFLSDKQLLRMTEKLKEVKLYVESKGIPFIVMFCTDKESIYPEYYPKLISRGSEPIQLDIITNYLRENTNIDIFNIRKALLAKKETYLLYVVSTGDLYHYNQIGAFFAYRELMKHINIHFPQIIPYELNDIEISYDEFGIPNVTLKSGFTYQKFDASFFESVDLYSRPFTWENHAYKNANPNLPVILFLCDSYAQEHFIGKYFAQQFGRAIFIHYHSIRYIKEYINYFKPDIIVLESTEAQLSIFANDVIGIPELR